MELDLLDDEVMLGTDYGFDYVPAIVIKNISSGNYTIFRYTEIEEHITGDKKIINDKYIKKILSDFHFSRQELVNIYISLLFSKKEAARKYAKKLKVNKTLLP